MNETCRSKILPLLTCFVLIVPQIVAAAEEKSTEVWETLDQLVSHASAHWGLDLLYEEYEKATWEVAIVEERGNNPTPRED